MPIGHHVHVPRHDELVPWPVTEPYGDPAKARRAAARIQALARRFQVKRTMPMRRAAAAERAAARARAEGAAAVAGHFIAAVSHNPLQAAAELLKRSLRRAVARRHARERRATRDAMARILDAVAEHAFDELAAKAAVIWAAGRDALAADAADAALAARVEALVGEGVEDAEERGLSAKLMGTQLRFEANVVLPRAFADARAPAAADAAAAAAPSEELLAAACLELVAFDESDKHRAYATLTVRGAELRAALGTAAKSRPRQLWEKAVRTELPSRELLKLLVPHLAVFRSRERGIFLLQLKEG